ncbi:MAG: glycosyltransferase [Ignavibacteria bacterium]
MMAKISIIIPVYKNYKNLKSNIITFYKYLLTLNLELEIIVVNDGSQMPDGVCEILERIGCKIIFLDRNYGKGYALTQGVLGVTGDFVIFTDADIPYCYTNYKDAIIQIMNPLCDIVIGDRTLSSSTYYSKTSLLRSLGSKLFSKIVLGISDSPIKDTQCGLKGFKKETAKALFAKTRITGFAIDVEILYLAKLFSYNICSIPVQLRDNTESTVKVFKHGIQMIFDLAKIKLFQITKQYNDQA